MPVIFVISRGINEELSRPALVERGCSRRRPGHATCEPPCIAVLEPGMHDARLPAGCCIGLCDAIGNDGGVVNNGRIAVHLNSVKTQFIRSDGVALTACSSVFAESGAIHRRWRDVWPYGYPVVRERDQSLSIAFFDERPIFLLGLPDLTLLRGKICDIQRGHVLPTNCTTEFMVKSG